MLKDHALLSRFNWKRKKNNSSLHVPTAMRNTQKIKEQLTRVSILS